MHKGRAVFLILLCLLSAGLVVACGDDEDSGGGGSAEEFIAEADGICTDIAEEALANPTPTPTNAEETVPVLEESIQRREDALEEFEGLGKPPAGIADEWEQSLGIQRQRLANGRELLKMARRGVEATEPQYANVVAENSELEDEENAILADIGSTACAEILPPDERKKIVEFVTFWETQPLDDCTKYTTQDGIELGWGSVEECQKAQENPPPEGFTKRVKVTHIEGIAGVSASVDASLFGGIGDGQKVTYGVVFEDGRYKVDSVTLQAGT